MFVDDKVFKPIYKEVYPGVYTASLYESSESVNIDGKSIPVTTCHAVKISPGSRIKKHYHERNAWSEILIFPFGGNFLFSLKTDDQPYNTRDYMEIYIKPEQVYGIKNMSYNEDLIFISIAVPGFIGLEEIVEVE